ncbi:hypothetical protein T11_18120 [Trichinella zimbabwensis]|uniref:Uncharacterized protein n=1 Tax=Trichinella zimbabwensis TaxID=268475 RepID=A0A0V1I8B5_9BILA|nr:hypothetical protein T11_18120 [Trichinella zimbabwensis]
MEYSHITYYVINYENDGNDVCMKAALERMLHFRRIVFLCSFVAMIILLLKRKKMTCENEINSNTSELVNLNDSAQISVEFYPKK